MLAAPAPRLQRADTQRRAHGPEACSTAQPAERVKGRPLLGKEVPARNCGRDTRRLTSVDPIPEVGARRRNGVCSCMETRAPETRRGSGNGPAHTDTRRQPRALTHTNRRPLMQVPPRLPRSATENRAVRPGGEARVAGPARPDPGSRGLGSCPRHRGPHRS